MEPFGERRDDWRAAKIEAMIFNMAVAKESRKPVKDFLLQFEEVEPEEKQPPQHWQFKLAALTAAGMAFGSGVEAVDLDPVTGGLTIVTKHEEVVAPTPEPTVPEAPTE